MILNYTTEVPVEKSLGEITSLLVRKGARTISSEFDDAGAIIAVSFILVVGGLPARFKLPSNPGGVAQAMLREQPYTTRRRGTREQYEASVLAQATRVSWRILKDWVEAQLALIESEQAEMGQVFLPYAVAEDGRTAYQHFIESQQRRLASGA